MRPRGWGVVFQGEKAARLGRGDGQRNNEFVSLQKKELHALATYPLHAVALDRSPLVIMAGSHRWEGTQDVRFFNHTNLAELEEKFRDAGKEVRIVPMTLKKGQVSFHHAWTIHGSYAKTSGLPRLSYAVHLQDGPNHRRPFRTAQGREIHIFDEKLCRTLPNSDPDFSDPAVFPTVWSENA